MTIKYTGKHGEFIHGIPARNLTDEEWDDLTKEQRKFALESGLYVKPDTAAHETKAEAKAAEHKTAGG